MSAGKFEFNRPSAWDYSTAVRTLQTGLKIGIRSVDLFASKYTAESRHDLLDAQFSLTLLDEISDIPFNVTANIPSSNTFL